MASTTTPMPHQRGAFIVIEGLDRSGKTTQVQLLADALKAKGSEVRTLRFPDRTTPIGKMINQYLTSQSELEDHVIHLLFSANRWELAKSIEEDVARGVTVVCDRYTHSGMVYSAAKQNPNLSLIWAREPDVGLPRPDIVVFLDLELEEAEKRGGYGDEKYEKREMQQEVRRLFQKIAKKGHEDAGDINIINAGPSVEVVHERVLNLVDDLLEEMREVEDLELRKIKKWRPKLRNE